MRRFIITSPKYSGEAEVTYDSEGRLIKFDVMATDMLAASVQKFKLQVPALVDALPEAFQHATVVEVGVEISFEDWWKAYDKKINKKRCEPLWAKLSLPDRARALHGVKAYDKFLKGLTYNRPKADPEKYLKDRYWENDWK